jgi:hypothetical protein
LAQRQRIVLSGAARGAIGLALFLASAVDISQNDCRRVP